MMKLLEWLTHDILGWHKPNDNYERRGINIISTCKICGKKIMQDSQGNWFLY